MTKTAIESHNQSGGITAGTVNMGDSSGFATNLPSPPKESRARALLWWVSGIASLVGVGIAAYRVFIG